MAGAGIDIQRKVTNLFSAFFSQQFLLVEVFKFQNENDLNNAPVIEAMLRAEAHQLNIPFKMHATQFVKQAFITMINDESCNGDMVCAIAANFVNQSELDISEIQIELSNYPNLIPPPVLVKLDKIGVISLIHYLRDCMECPKKTSALSKYIFKSTCDVNNVSGNNHLLVLRYLLNTIVQFGYGTLPSEMQKDVSGQTIKTSVLLLNQYTRKIWDFLWQHPEIEINGFDILVQSKNLELSQVVSYQKCYMEQLTYIISYKPEIKASTAINSQHDWTFFKSPKNVVSFVTQLLIPLEVEKVVEKIDEILERYEVNWKTLLLVVSIIQTCHPTGNKLLKVLANSLLQRAMDKLQVESLLACFLVSRQIHAENTNTFHYGGWFSSTSSYSTTSRQFCFLLKFLSSIVRHEPSWVLNAHKNFPPYIPVVDNCRGVWTDYVALIRTRLEDLKLQKPNEEIAEEDASLVKEVDTAILDFEKNGRIPSRVIEAAIFRKPYFTNKFLSVLLKPRRIPNPPDVREDFIEELKKSGKLPLAQYDAYHAECKAMGQQNSSAEKMDWESSDEVSSYETLMNQIVLCKDFQQQKVLCDQLNAVLSNMLPQPSASSPIELYPDRNQSRTKTTLEWKIVESWIESIQSSFSVENETDWLNYYFLPLCQYPSLVEILFSSVWESTQLCYDDEDKIRKIGVIIYLISRNVHLLPPIRYEAFRGDFIQFLTSAEDLVSNNANTMLFRLRLFYFCAIEAQSHKALESVHLVTSLYLWLARRIAQSHKMDQYKKYLKLAKELTSLKETKLPIARWLQLEITVEPEHDILTWTERSGYLNSTLTVEYPSVSVAELGSITLDCIIQRGLTGKRIGCSDSSKDLLLLLQSFVITRHSNESESSAWLTKYWLQLHRDKGTTIDQYLWSFVCLLPPYLLVRNSMDQPVSENSLTILGRLIEDNWRDSLTSFCAWLPKYIAIHLIRAFDGTQTSSLEPCLQFSAQIHCIEEVSLSGKWKTLQSALKIFNPSTCDHLDCGAIQWSNVTEVDILVGQMIVLDALVSCAKDNSHPLPSFAEELGSHIQQKPYLLKSWKMSFWTGEDSVLPWQKILPTYLKNLLPYVIVKVLISWSSSLHLCDHSIAFEYLEGSVSAYNAWIDTTNSFFESLDDEKDKRKSEYPAGQLLDLVSLGSLSRDIQLILKTAPVQALKTLKQSSSYRSLERDLQRVVNQRCP